MNYIQEFLKECVTDMPEYQLPLWYKIRSDQLNLLGRLSECGQPVQWSMVVVELLQIHASKHHSYTGLIL